MASTILISMRTRKRCSWPGMRRAYSGWRRRGRADVIVILSSGRQPRMAQETYPFRSSEDERRRLIAQDGLVAASTQRLFEKAGITSGMHVLDIGSGAGDVAFLAARLVGPQGSVIGIDRDPTQAAFAAIVGRLVLMYAADPVEALRRAMRNLRTGGVIALQESVVDYDGPVLIEPADCLAAKVVDWFRAGFKHAGVQARMGMRLFGLMRAAGLHP